MKDQVDGVELRKPEWLKVRFGTGFSFSSTAAVLKRFGIHTVCQEAHCPNMGECFESRTATFLILGPTCTRNCRYCAVLPGRTLPPDETEPKNIALAIKELGLKHAVVTSVTRDDLPDGGARHFASTIREIHELIPSCRVEVLVPDFQGRFESLETVVAQKPTIFNHNIETVQLLYSAVRPQASYDQSIVLLAKAKKIDPHMITKSGIMVGLGESKDEIIESMWDLREAECDILTIGQYLRPSTAHLPVKKYYEPSEFSILRNEALSLGFRWVESGPLVRSSYHAALQTGHLR